MVADVELVEDAVARFHPKASLETLRHVAPGRYRQCREPRKRALLPRPAVRVAVAEPQAVELSRHVVLRSGQATGRGLPESW